MASVRCVKRLDEPREHAQRRPGEGEAGDAGHQRQQRALGQQLAHQPAAPGPQGGAHGELAVAAQHPRQRQVGDVGAGQQQHQAGRAEQQPQDRPRVGGQRRQHRRGAGAEPGLGAIDVREVLLEPLRHGGHLGGRRLEGHPGLEQPEHLQPREGAPVGDDVALRRRAERARRGRHVDVDAVGIVRHVRHHADDGVRPVVHLEHLADDVRVAAEPGGPVVVAEHEHRLGALVVVGIGEGAADERPDAEHVEEVVRDHAGGHPVGLAAPQQIEVHLVELHQAVQAGELLAVVVELLDRDAEVLLVGQRRGVADDHQPLAVGVRQRREEHAVHHAEDRRVGADAEAQREHGDRGVAGRLPQGAGGVAHVLHAVVEPADAAGVARLLDVPGHRPEVLQRPGAGGLGIESLPHVLLGLHVEVERHLGVQLPIELLTGHERLESLPHGMPQLSTDRILATAPVIRSHDACSSRSCFCPALVRR